MKEKILDTAKFCAAIKKARLTEEELASKIQKTSGESLSVSAIHEYKRGTREPSPLVLAQLAKVLGVDENELLFDHPVNYEIYTNNGTITLPEHRAKALEIARAIIVRENISHLVESYKTFKSYIDVKCEPYWKQLSKKPGVDNVPFTQNKIYIYTKRNRCKKSDFERVEELLIALDEWDNDKHDRWNELTNSVKFGIDWLVCFSPKIVELADMLLADKDTCSSDFKSLNRVKSFFDLLPSILDLDEVPYEGLSADEVEQEAKIKIMPNWNNMPITKQLLVINTLQYVVQFVHGDEALKLAHKYKNTPVACIDILCAYIMSKADDEQLESMRINQNSVNSYEKLAFSDTWELLLIELNRDDSAFYSYEQCEDIDYNSWKLFHSFFIYLEIIEKNKIEDIPPTFDILNEGYTYLLHIENQPDAP